MSKSIKKHGENWKNVNFLVFSTYIWWMNTFNMKVRRGSFDQGSIEYDDVARHVAYGKVLKTWSKWVDKNVNQNRTQVFFMSMSPLHIKSLDWENPNGVKCALETYPILNQMMPLNVGIDQKLFGLAANVTKSMKVHIYFLNITTLFEYQKEAHTSGNVEHMFNERLLEFVNLDLLDVKEARKRFDKAHEKFLSLRKATRKDVATVLLEELHHARSTFKQAQFNPVTTLSNVESKKRFEFLKAVSETMVAHLLYFKQGYELLHQM